MSQHADARRERETAEFHVRQAINALTTAGMCLLRARPFIRDGQGNELTTALRDDITTMVGDAEALIAVIRQA